MEHYFRKPAEKAKNKKRGYTIKSEMSVETLKMLRSACRAPARPAPWWRRALGHSRWGLSALYSSSASSGAGKEAYKRLDQISHVLLRPGMYVGSTARHTDKMWLPSDPESLPSSERSAARRRGKRWENQHGNAVPGRIVHSSS